MDSDLSDIPAAGSRRLTLWPGLWVPAAILLTGLALTLLTARLASDTAHQLARQHYQAMHQTLVSQVVIHLHSVPAATSVLATLEPALADIRDPRINLRIDTLERHSKTPLLQLGNNGNTADGQSMRTELETAGRHWMVTTAPDIRLVEWPARKTYFQILTGGLLMTGAAVLLALLLCRRGHRQHRTLQKLTSQARSGRQQITNLQVEKNVLRQALNDSESRSRDLVALSGSLICELDEQGQIGFISAHAADLIGQAPSDLLLHPFDELVAAVDHERFHQCLMATRQEPGVARVDVHLLHRSQTKPVPVVIRVMAVKDPLHGLAGYRLSALPDPNRYSG